MISRKLTITFYLAGIILLSLTAKIWTDKQSQPKSYILINKPFDLELFFKSQDYEIYGEKIGIKQDYITAIYLISTASCSPCINEIISFISFFERQKINNIPVQQIVVVLDSSKKRALRFIKTAELSTSTMVGYDKKYAPILQSFGTIYDNHQLILIDNNKQTIFLRIHLRQSKISSTNYKEEILKIAKKALDNLYY